MQRVSAALIHSVAPTNIVSERSDIHNRTPITIPSSKQGTSRPIPVNSGSVQTGNRIELAALTGSSSGDEWVTSAKNRIIGRYNFRPNRPKNFTKDCSPCLVDRTRFPHFSQVYETYWKQHATPDTDYSPPSQPPTPGSSDRSPSVALSLVSDASSLDLFGLEVRPVNSSDSSVSIAPNSPGDEFLSAEEYLPSP